MGKEIQVDINSNLIVEFLNEVILEPRKNILKWSKITKQTPALNIGYPAQHLSSLLTGYEGSRSGARGDDISDGSEVKACNRIDQVDKCKGCGEKVARSEETCPSCGSEKIERKNDSKWLFTVRSEKELEELLTAERVLLILSDYPNFEESDFEKIRIRVFEIYPKNNRHRRFVEIMKHYYYKIYSDNLEKSPKKVPAPKNFWPESYQFYLSNPIKIFECVISSVNENPIIESIYFIPPSVNREELSSEILPKSILSKSELQLVKHIDREYLSENEKELLPLRD